MSKTDLEQGLNLTNDGKVPARRFPEFRNFPLWQKLQLNQVLDYERPDKYIVNSTNYKTAGIPVLTANKSFVLGYTQEDSGIYEYLPVVIFDDFTTDKKFVDFPFKIKSSAIKILKPKNNENLKFIFEVMNQIKFEVSDHKRHYISEYQNLVVKIPEFTEQKKIADCLTSLDNLISQKQSELGALAKYKKGLLQQLFPQGNHNLPTKRFPEFNPSTAWEIKFLKEISENLDNQRVPITSNNRIKGEIPYYGASGIIDFVNDFIFDEDLLCVSEDGANLVMRTSPIAFSVSGKLWINNHAHVLKFKHLSTQIIVNNYLNSIKLDDFLTGIAQPKLNKAMLDNIPVCLPPQPEEQKKIADCLTSLDSLIDLKKQELDKLVIYKKGLLQQLLVQG